MAYPTEEGKQSLTLSTRKFPFLPDFSIDDEGALILKFRVIGVNKYDDEMGAEEISYTLEYEVDDVKMKQISLREATERASKGKDIYVKTQSNPAP